MASHILWGVAAWLFTLALVHVDSQSTTQEFNLWSHINVGHLEYEPSLVKHSNPPDVVGQSVKTASQHADGNLAAYFHATTGQSSGRVAPPFRPQHYSALVNIDRRLIYFKTTHTASTSLWRAWIAPALCPPRSPGR